jgi:hypothetical protein
LEFGLGLLDEKVGFLDLFGLQFKKETVIDEELNRV